MVTTPGRTLHALVATCALLVLSENASFACAAYCADGSSCTGNYCYCYQDFGAVCTDESIETAASLYAQEAYIRSFATPGLNRFADATEKIADAMVQGDKDAYFLGILEQEDVIESLTTKEHQILNSWNR